MKIETHTPHFESSFLLATVARYTFPKPIDISFIISTTVVPPMKTRTSFAQ
jgi:hypothetical protein